MKNEMMYTQKLEAAVKDWDASQLVAYFGTVAGRLALDPNNRELVLEHRVLGDELMNRMN